MRYDDGALVIADDADKISLPVAKAIFEEVQDGGVVTPTEWRTLRYIADGGKDGAQYALTAPARKYLLDLVRAEEGAGRRRRTATGGTTSRPTRRRTFPRRCARSGARAGTTPAPETSA